MHHCEIRSRQEELQSAFDNDGYLILPGFFNTQEVAEMALNIDRVIAEIVPVMPESHVYYENKNNRQTLKQIQKLNEHDRWFGALMEVGPVRALSEILLKSGVDCINMQFFNKPPGIGQATPPHQDGYYFKLEPSEALTAWVALEPTNAENGALSYLQGSHKESEFRKHGRSNVLGFSRGILDFDPASEGDRAVTHNAEAGTLMMHHARTIHWAGANVSKTRSRRALGCIYYADYAKIDELAATAYQDKLDAALRRSGKI